VGWKSVGIVCGMCVAVAVVCACVCVCGGSGMCNGGSGMFVWWW